MPLTYSGGFFRLAYVSLRKLRVVSKNAKWMGKLFVAKRVCVL